MIKFLLLLSVLFPSTQLLAQDTTRVLLVGDSWAQQQWDDGIHAQVFSNNGYPNILVDGSSTARSGTESAGWIMQDQLQIIADALSTQPDIDTVQLTIGGNDFLNAWNANMTNQQVMDLQQQIVSDTNIIVDFILAQNPKIEIILSFYDYPNFVDTIKGFTQFFCRDLYVEIGSPSTTLLNTTAQQFELAYAQIATDNPRVYHVSHFGLMQSYFLNPPILPPGDVSLPSPLAAMRVTLGINDCFHLNPEGYGYLIQNLYDGYFKTRFDQLFKGGFE